MRLKMLEFDSRLMHKSEGLFFSFLPPQFGVLDRFGKSAQEGRADSVLVAFIAKRAISKFQLRISIGKPQRVVAGLSIS